MVKNGLRVMDSDLHLMEPPDLFERYWRQSIRPERPVRPEISRVTTLAGCWTASRCHRGSTTPKCSKPTQRWTNGRGR
jgi:hypothetical protein